MLSFLNSNNPIPRFSEGQARSIIISITPLQAKVRRIDKINQRRCVF